MHISIAIVSTQLNGFNYCYQTLLILFNINNLFVDSEVITYAIQHSIQYYSFVCTHLKGSKYYYVISIIQFTHTQRVKEFQVLHLTLIILFNITHLFAHS